MVLVAALNSTCRDLMSLLALSFPLDADLCVKTTEVQALAPGSRAVYDRLVVGCTTDVVNQLYNRRLPPLNEADQIGILSYTGFHRFASRLSETQLQRAWPLVQNIAKYTSLVQNIGPSLGMFEGIAANFIQQRRTSNQTGPVSQMQIVQELLHNQSITDGLATAIEEPGVLENIFNNLPAIIGSIGGYATQDPDPDPEPEPEPEPESRRSSIGGAVASRNRQMRNKARSSARQNPMTRMLEQMPPIDPSSIHEMAQGIASSLRDPSLRDEISEAVRAFQGFQGTDGTRVAGG